MSSVNLGMTRRKERKLGEDSNYTEENRAAGSKDGEVLLYGSDLHGQVRTECVTVSM